MALVFGINDAVEEMALVGGQVHFARARLEEVCDALQQDVFFERRYGDERGPFAVATLVAIRADEHGLFAQFLAPRLISQEGPLASFVESSLSSHRFDYDVAPQPLFSLPETPDIKPMVNTIIDAYERHCAFTGEFLVTRGTGAEATWIQPLSEGGPFALSNMIVGVPGALNAFRRGHLTLGQHGEFIVALDQIDPELLAMLNPTGRIVLPEFEQARPDPAALEWHRTVIFNRANR